MLVICPLLMKTSSFLPVTEVVEATAVSTELNEGKKGTSEDKKTVEDKKTLSYEVLPNGNAADRKNKEGRSFSHSDLEPTGLFLKKGESLHIEVEKGENLFVYIGQYGVYANLNNNEAVGSQKTELEVGSNEIVADTIDGMVYLVNKSEDKSALISIDGGHQVPLFSVGKTTKEEWEQQVESFSDAPFIELVGKHVFATYQADIVKEKSLSAESIQELLEQWDQVYVWQNELFGLGETTGISKKYSNNRVHITNPDTGAGYASATESRITFQNDTGAGRDLLSGNLDQWALWHEMGHTYQSSDYKFYNTGEVTVNIPALYIQKKLGLMDRWHQEPYKIENIKIMWRLPIQIKRLTNLVKITKQDYGFDWGCSINFREGLGIIFIQV